MAERINLVPGSEDGVRAAAAVVFSRPHGREDCEDEQAHRRPRRLCEERTGRREQRCGKCTRCNWCTSNLQQLIRGVLNTNIRGRGVHDACVAIKSRVIYSKTKIYARNPTRALPPTPETCTNADAVRRLPVLPLLSASWRPQLAHLARRSHAHALRPRQPPV